MGAEVKRSMRILHIEVRPHEHAGAPAHWREVVQRLTRRPEAGDVTGPIRHVSLVTASPSRVELAVFVRTGLLAPVARAYAALDARLAEDPALCGWRLPTLPQSEPSPLWHNAEDGAPERREDGKDLPHCDPGHL